MVIPLTKTEQLTTTAADYSGVPETLTFESGDTEKTFTFTAIDDEDDNWESVKITLGTLPAGVSEGTNGETIVSITDDELSVDEQKACDDAAVWCAKVKFAMSTSNDHGRKMGLGYHPTQDPYTYPNSSLKEDNFTFRGRNYRVWYVLTWPGVDPATEPRPQFGIPERSRFSVHIGEGTGNEATEGVPEAHYEDWTLHIDGTELRFTDIEAHNQGAFVWLDIDFHELYKTWEDDTEYSIWLEETPLSERKEQPAATPSSPRYLRIQSMDQLLVVNWKEPANDGNSQLTEYKVQWKENAENIDEDDEKIVAHNEGYTGALTFIPGPQNMTVYAVRIIAVNGEGDSPPSDIHFGMPQPHTPELTESTVNADTLTMTYDTNLDTNSPPSKDHFWVSVNGGLRTITGISISAGMSRSRLSPAL